MEVGALGDPHKPSSKDINKMNRKLTGLSTQFTQLMAAFKEDRDQRAQAAKDNKANSKQSQGTVCRKVEKTHVCKI